jgi:hypothetical protein
MKFNWGTGIFIFLLMFLAACAVFIVFALRQDVNLVHKDYYEKGVDYTEQMNVNARSEPLKKDIHVSQQEKFLQVEFENSLAAKIDTGSIHFYRPSNQKLDVFYTMELTGNILIIPKDELNSGRYLLKLSWFTDGLRYEYEKPVDIH